MARMVWMPSKVGVSQAKDGASGLLGDSVMTHVVRAGVTSH